MVLLIVSITGTLSTNSFAQPFTFQSLQSNIDEFTDAAISLADVNADGKHDLLLSGSLFSRDGEELLSRIYHVTEVVDYNQGDSIRTSRITLTPGVDLRGLVHAAHAWTDLSSTGYPSLALTGSLTKRAPYAPELHIYTFSGDGPPTQRTVASAGVVNGTMRWADLDLDGDLDLILSGGDAQGRPVLQTIEQTPDGFIDRPHGLESLGFGGMHLTDITGDGIPEVLIQGINEAGTFKTRVIRILGEFDLQMEDPGLPGFAYGDIVSADVNADGKADIIMGGLQHTPVTPIGQTVQVSIAPDLAVSAVTGIPIPFGGGDLFLADDNHDNQVDFILSGMRTMPYDAHTARWFAGEGTSFAPRALLHPSFPMKIARGDLDGDGSLDLVTTGTAPGGREILQFYRNTTRRPNEAPEPPTTLSAVRDGAATVFSWDGAFDYDARPEGLRYRLELRRTDGTILRGSQQRVNGDDLFVATESILSGTTQRLLLPNGTYEWRVISVDLGLKASVPSQWAPLTIQGKGTNGSSAEGTMATASSDVRFSTFPSPTTGQLTVTFAMAEGADVSLELVDILGRRHIQNALGYRASGAQAISWDLKAAGATYAPGLYFVILRTGNQQQVQRVILQ